MAEEEKREHPKTEHEQDTDPEVLIIDTSDNKDVVLSGSERDRVTRKVKEKKLVKV